MKLLTTIILLLCTQAAVAQVRIASSRPPTTNATSMMGRTQIGIIKHRAKNQGGTATLGRRQYIYFSDQDLLRSIRDGQAIAPVEVDNRTKAVYAVIDLNRHYRINLKDQSTLQLGTLHVSEDRRSRLSVNTYINVKEMVVTRRLSSDLAAPRARDPHGESSRMTPKFRQSE